MELLNNADFSMMLSMKAWLESRGFIILPPNIVHKSQDNCTIQAAAEHIPRRCERCQSWKHGTSFCTSTQIFCSVCAGPHKSRKCRRARKNGHKIAYKCANCRISGHSAASKFCPFRPAELAQMAYNSAAKHKICTVKRYLNDNLVSDVFYDCVDSFDNDSVLPQSDDSKPASQSTAISTPNMFLLNSVGTQTESVYTQT